MSIRVSARAVIIQDDAIRHWAGDRHAMSLISACQPQAGSQAKLPATPDSNQTGVRWVRLADLGSIELLPHVTDLILEYARTGSFRPIFLEEPVQPERAQRYVKEWDKPV